MPNTTDADPSRRFDLAAETARIDRERARLAEVPVRFAGKPPRFDWQAFGLILAGMVLGAAFFAAGMLTVALLPG